MRWGVDTCPLSRVTDYGLTGQSDVIDRTKKNKQWLNCEYKLYHDQYINHSWISLQKTWDCTKSSN